MTHRSREHRNRAITALRERGAAITGVEQNKHTVIAFETPDGAGKLAIASTPSDHRAALNVEADIRRKLAEISARGNSKIMELAPEIPPLPRVRQAPWPTRNMDRTTPYWAGPPEPHKKARLRKVRVKAPIAAVDPAVKALEILGAMECIAISRLAAAAERRGDRWRDIIARSTIGAPYLRLQGSAGARLSAKFRLWADRCPPEKTKELWARREDFLEALSEIARGYADQMPERAKLISDAWQAFEWVSGMCREVIPIPKLCLGWPPCLLPGRLTPEAYLPSPTKLDAAMAALKTKEN